MCEKRPKSITYQCIFNRRDRDDPDQLTEVAAFTSSGGLDVDVDDATAFRLASGATGVAVGTGRTAEEQAAAAMAKATMPWHLETTERNLRLVREVRTARGEDAAWIKELEDALAQKREEMQPPSMGL